VVVLLVLVGTCIIIFVCFAGSPLMFVFLYVVVVVVVVFLLSVFFSLVELSCCGCSSCSCRSSGTCIIAVFMMRLTV
jgi:hypothetical protein